MTNEITPPERLRAFIAQNGMKLPSNLFATVNFSWGELLKNQTEVPTLEVLKNLLTIAQVLQRYRNTIFKKPITITSGWRSERYNKSIGGAKESYHIQGKALDFVVEGFTPQKVQAMLDPVHNGGMEYAPTWSHIDIGTKRRFKP